jgi:endonuclease/exonuclease/phosphatase family metal-dependent hydrolase
MRRMGIILFTSALLLLSFRGMSQSIKVATYNIRVDIPSDTANSWDRRKEALVDLLQFYRPDILGIQEGLNHQIQYIRDGISNYEFAGGGRTDGKTLGEYSCIFYNTGRFEKISDSTFWLSATPEKNSRGWDAAYDRICTCTLLQDKLTQKYIWVFNTHLDNVGVQARMKGTELILERIRLAGKKDYPVLFMGDMNSGENDPPVQKIKKTLSDSKTASETKPYGPTGTFNGFNSMSLLNERIDFIFISPDKVNVRKYIVVDDRFGTKYPSDHLPVIVDIDLK